MTDPASPILQSTPPPAIGRQIAIFLDLIKFAHSIFALPFALIATFWAFRAIGVSPLSAAALERLALILACMVVARTWAMTVNRLVDRRFDAANPRTARRPSVTGAVSARFMAATLAACAVSFLAATAAFWLLFGNPWPLAFALPVLAWLGAYSFTKRFTALCHFWLGFSLGLAPLSAWVAIAGSDAGGAHLRTILLLTFGVTTWVAGFDILYALQDESFDREQALHSLPAALGRAGALHISRACHLLTLAAFFGVGVTGGFHALYWVGFGAAALLMAIEQSLVSPRDISRVNIAFMTVNGIVGLIFGVLTIADILLL
ncbi:MAG TPA: 4-hydroxybenzoate octaprenyltransferase [Phycisphaerae bacterium]|nr:4-hydroxybenzoate octaprenyltransferase [Phycisphaerae bacterium]